MRSIFLLLQFLLMGIISVAQSSYQYYYLAIGSAHYERDPSRVGIEEYSPQNDIESATTSTLIMQQLLEKNIKAKGITVISTEDSLVTKKRVLNEMDRLVAMIKKDNAPKPFIIFYYCGHGTLEKSSLTQMLLLGEYALDLKKRKVLPSSKNVWSDKLMIINDISDFFSDKNYEYMLLVECCRQHISEESGTKLAIDTILGTANRLIDSFGKMYGISEDDLRDAKEEYKVAIDENALGFKVINQFKQANPVVFATVPGQSTATVQIPNTKSITLENVDLTSEIGPLCRRSVIAFDNFFQSEKSIYLMRDYVANLLDNSLDAGSKTSISGYIDNPKHAKEVVLIKK